MLEKVKPVLDTSYKPYFSDGNQEDDKEPKFYQTDEGQLVLKKVAAVRNIPDTYSCVINKLSPAANVKAPTTKKTSTVNVQTSAINM
ncbi:hypothetical protein DSO57_1016767 [Entomophthora muscae]|uniref:Uncharacterized protein n=1 Tax=Entomophthora muscae TaxID=34485 RepID=A0ACC2T570_9FUNG|nr:hypothetical protein DSO57_1016767 [Entomophthora muscae]